MIRLAFLGVVLGAGLLAYLGFAVMRSSGDAPAPTAESAPTPEITEAADQPSAAPRRVFLQGEDLSNGMLVLVLHGAGTGGADLVVTDRDALMAAQDSAWVTEGDTPIATLYRDDATALTVTGDAENADLSTLTAAADPLIQIDDVYDDYTAYLDALTAIAADPDFALLGHADVHPAPQQTPSATLVLPTITRPATQSLNVETHTALVSALVSDALPAGTTLKALTITPLGAPIVIDADNGRAATAGGAEIPFPEVQVYSVTATLSGTSDLSDETLQSLTDQTTLTIDYTDEARAFIARLGLPCADCFAIAPKGDTYTEATITTRQAEAYPLSYYDLREAP
ncbi:hypothetical protein [Pseudooctadecabacter jejudonensis]|uniref:Uncharacterized protein n=1 Tax=Pseudooctadecabacter jejudonensis TaxID=1391910 RepID=A0A1Y5RN41_9RHOB|nr:hypothetical protein [Pseudooctadecabacter jejudonensis]SLN21323.1 hypothetical protein PSJ8397_00821 [Pseudooctadecabacter jejudonensis]